MLGRVVRWRIPGLRRDLTFRELFREQPFTLLDEGDTHSVSGLGGRIWTVHRDYPQLDGPQDFRDYHDPGTVRVLFANWVEPAGDGRQRAGLRGARRAHRRRGRTAHARDLARDGRLRAPDRLRAAGRGRQTCGGRGMTRSGFVALAGRPNVGKSTLVNAIVGAKVAIVSDKPQTTRRAIRGVATGPERQMVLVDLPGVQRPRDALTERMQHAVERELAESDAALFVINGEQGIGPGDRFIAEALASAKVPVVIAVNKVDRLGKHDVVPVLQAAADLGVADEIFPVSARRGTGVGPLVEHLVEPAARGAVLLPGRGAHRPARGGAARRAGARAGAAPHPPGGAPRRRGAGRGDRAARRRPDLRARRHLDRDRVPEGHPDRRGRADGQGDRQRRARELERELATRVHLELSVRVRRRWRADDALLDRLGIE